MSDTATVRIFLVHGDPASVKTAEISNWTGKAVSGPRSQLEIVLQREEAGKPGVYFLTGVNPETGKERVYIGEAEIIRSRIKNHLDRDFWNTASFFVSKDENLTKAHIKYLEGQLKRDYEFSSPSAAASVVHGGHANGLREWKDPKGVLLKDKEEKELSNKIAAPSGGHAAPVGNSGVTEGPP